MLLVELAGRRLSVELETIRPLIQAALLNLHALLMALFVGLSASMIGAVYGLLLVEEREERTLSSVRVMPIGFASYVLARMALPTFLATVVTALAYPVAGIAPLPAVTVLLVAAAGATLVPVITLAIVTFAPGRVAALALVRVATLLAVLPVIAWFVDAPGEWVLAPIGSYWQMRALWSAMEGSPVWADLVTAVGVNAVLTVLLYRRFEARPE
jgi:fluoroquinolone transport system permease protein